MHWEKRQKFSIRKFSVGAASVLIGQFFVGQNLGDQLVSADEVAGLVEEATPVSLESSPSAVDNTITSVENANIEGGTSRATSSLEDKEVPSASAGTAFSASSEAAEGPAASTERPADKAESRQEGTPTVEVQSVDKEGLKQAYARLHSLLQQDLDLADKPADAVANYRQARQEAESLEQRVLATLASQTATAEEVSQLQAQLVASSNKLEASIASLQVAVKPAVPAPVAGEEAREKAEGKSVSSPVEAAPAPAEKAITRVTETNLAADADKPATAQNPAVKPDLTAQAAPSIATEKKTELDKLRAVADAVEKIEEAQAKAIDYTVVYLDKQTGLEVWREKKSYTPVTKENELDKDATITVKPEISAIKELEGYRIEGAQEKTLSLSPSKDNVIDFAVAAAGKKRGVRSSRSFGDYSGSPTIPSSAKLIYQKNALSDRGVKVYADYATNTLYFDMLIASGDTALELGNGDTLNYREQIRISSTVPNFSTQEIYKDVDDSSRWDITNQKFENNTQTGTIIEVNNRPSQRRAIRHNIVTKAVVPDLNNIPYLRIAQGWIKPGRTPTAIVPAEFK